jgi:Geranylgeranyl pyrophosphate synthase
MLQFEDTLSIINERIRQIPYPSQPENLYKPIAYLLSLKGKKVRPAITLLACNLYIEDIEEAIDPALAWEIFHNFTLMHDDVMDKADMRRGQLTVHKKWNENTAILSGDSMLILAYTYMAKSPGRYLKTLLDLFSRTADEICAGQQYDMDFETRLDISEEEYIRMIRLKTAVMLAACLQTGGIVGGASDADQKNLYEFGINLGISFQIRDDLLDVYGDPKVFGKQIGGDILCNKKTFLLIQALSQSEGEEKDSLLSWLNTTDRTDEKIAAVKEIYTGLGLKEKAENRINEYCLKAKNALDALSVSQDRKSILSELAQSLMGRES